MTSGLYVVKPWFVRRLRRVEDWLVARRVSPGALTWAAVAVSAAAGVALASGGLSGDYTWWLLVPPLAVVRLALNALDGAVARRTSRETSSGMLANEIGDRLSDTALMVPTALAVEPALALGATAAAYMTSLTGVLGMATGGRRLNGGPMGKADRVAVLGVAGAAGAVTASAAPLTVALVVVVAGCAVTIVLRLRTLTRMGAGDD
jgi:CDP-diacylglycerol---glycerol-3-phosphate 3-phosphatidyltransferase